MATLCILAVAALALSCCGVYYLMLLCYLAMRYSGYVVIVRR